MLEDIKKLKEADCKMQLTSRFHRLIWSGFSSLHLLRGGAENFEPAYFPKIGPNIRNFARNSRWGVEKCSASLCFQRRPYLFEPRIMALENQRNVQTKIPEDFQETATTEMEIIWNSKNDKSKIFMFYNI